MNDDYSDFVGIGKSDDINDRIEFARKMARSKKAFKIYLAYNRIKNTIICPLPRYCHNYKHISTELIS
jgi:hypothetical protein